MLDYFINCTGFEFEFRGTPHCYNSDNNMCIVYTNSNLVIRNHVIVGRLRVP